MAADPPRAAAAAGRRRWARLFVLALALFAPGCDRRNYDGASFPPDQGPRPDAALHLVVYRPEGEGVSWGDAALYHRESPAAVGAVPVAYRVGVDGQPPRAADREGVFGTRRFPGPAALAVELAGRVVRRRVELAGDSLRVELWSLERDGSLLGVGGRYPRTALTSWPVEALSREVGLLRRLRHALDRGFRSGRVADLEELFTADFRDPLGGRKDFLRAASFASVRGEPWRVAGDSWLDLDGERRRVHLRIDAGEGRRFPTLELAPAAMAALGYRVRTWF